MGSVTIKDVASKAGVSLSAVSSVLNKRKSWVGEKTRKRICEAARELGYRPNLHARKLKTGKTGFYRPYPEREDPQTDEIFLGFQKALGQQASAEARLTVINPFEILGASERESNFRMAYEVAAKLAAGEVKSAVFAPLDACAYGFVKGFRARGLRVPEDVAVIGFDDEATPEYFDTDLTTVHHPFREKGRRAARASTGK